MVHPKTHRCFIDDVNNYSSRIKSIKQTLQKFFFYTYSVLSYLWSAQTALQYILLHLYHWKITDNYQVTPCISEGHPTTYFQIVVKSTLNNFTGTKNNKIIVFEHYNFAKRCSFFPSQLGCFSFSSQLGTEKEHLLRKLKCRI